MEVRHSRARGIQFCLRRGKRVGTFGASLVLVACGKKNDKFLDSVLAILLLVTITNKKEEFYGKKFG